MVAVTDKKIETGARKSHEKGVQRMPTARENAHSHSSF